MPDIPDGAKVPQDRLAKAEAKGQFVEFDFDGVHYAVDRDNAEDLELLEHVEDEKYLIAVRGYLGKDQWQKFKDSQRDAKGRVSSEKFEPFLNELMAAIGGGSPSAPNSAASSGS